MDYKKIKEIFDREYETLRSESDENAPDSNLSLFSSKEEAEQELFPVKISEPDSKYNGKGRIVAFLYDHSTATWEVFRKSVKAKRVRERFWESQVSGEE